MEVGLVQVAAIALFGLAGAIRPRRPDALLGADTWINLGTGALLFVFKLALLWWFIAALAGWGTGAVSMAALPLAAQWALAFLVLDLTRWALHMLHHRVPWLWTFHRVHHSPTTLNSTSGLRMHLVDFVQLAFLPTVLFAVLFDISHAPAWFLPSLLIPGVVFDAFEHGNLRFDVRRPVQRLWDKLLNNPHFHAWHHTSDGHLRDGNYGNVLTIWDRLFGTCVSSDDLPEALGLDPESTLINGVFGLQALRPGPRGHES